MVAIKVVISVIGHQNRWSTEDFGITGDRFRCCTPRERDLCIAGHQVLRNGRHAWIWIRSFCVLGGSLRCQEENKNKPTPDEIHFRLLRRTFSWDLSSTFALRSCARSRRRSRAADQYRSYFAIHGVSPAARASGSS